MDLPDQSAARVEISCLAGVATEFIENSLVSSTHQSYSVGQEEYKEFCAHLNVPTASRRDCINPVHGSAITPPGTKFNAVISNGSPALAGVTRFGGSFGSSLVTTFSLEGFEESQIQSQGHPSANHSIHPEEDQDYIGLGA